MRPLHLAAGYPALAVASLALCLSPPASAQNDSGLSSGSGAGTGTGRSAGVYRPPGERTPTGGPVEGRGGPFPVPSNFPGGVFYGPGVNVAFPDDPTIAPFLALEQPAAGGQGSIQITQEMINTAKALPAAGERGRVLLQIARGAILGNQLRTANAALVAAAEAAEHEDDALIHDQLIISMITTAGLLSDSLLREAKPGLAIFADDAPSRAEPLPDDRLTADVAISLARLEWRRSVYMAARIKSATYRSEYMARAIENMADGSAVVALEYARPTDETSRDVDDKDAAEKHERFVKQADEILLEAERAADAIERPIWKNYARERIAIAAGVSGQYERATQVAAGIRNAEARARALVLVAESQARSNQNEAATRSYNIVGQSVASIRQIGLRAVMAGIMIDSLISTGRFDDARASLVLYPSDSERYVAMGAIAEAQGMRRMGPQAREWIDRDVPPEYRSTLYRRLSNGVLRAISEDRAKEFQGRGAGAG